MKQAHIYYLSGIAAVIIVILLSRGGEESPPPNPAALPSSGLSGQSTAEAAGMPAVETISSREIVEPPRQMPHIPLGIQKDAQEMPRADGLPAPTLAPAR